MTRERRTVPGLACALPPSSDFPAHARFAEELGYTRAWAFDSPEGADGLKARNLAARLHCSTRTLYEQVGNREALIRGLVAHAFARIEPDLHEGETWQESTTSWCLALRDTLLSRPELARLMKREDRNVVVG
jgi:AcrR family transcriptional regulator